MFANPHTEVITVKRTVTLVILGVFAAILLVYGIVSLTDNKSNPSIEDVSVSDSFVSESASVSVSETERTFPFFNKNDEKDEETTRAEEIAQTVANIINSERIEDYAYAYAGFTPAYADMNVSDWRLILVNRDYILPDGYEPKLAPCITDDPDSLKLDYRVAPYYNEMYQAALEDGVELTPISGYRSVARQKRNFENKIDTYMDQGYGKIEATQMAATIILPPGTSEHNAGLAMDICSLYESFENTDEFAWLSENAADYGFILRYPEDKQDITRIIYEPWHWRYVGVEAAKAMKASGQCLEEYLGVA